MTHLSNSISTSELQQRDAAHHMHPFTTQAQLSQKGARVITHAKGVEVAAPGAQAWNPAFDITPAHLVTGFITEFGILRPPYREVLSALPLPNQL